ncbi:Mini-ribonuclease 3 [Bacillota bacterium LCP21S3_A4]
MYSPLALAFLGDGVYSLIVRTMVISKGNRQAEKLHNDTRKYVSAQAQARIGDAIQELLTDEEARIYRRGRNANPYHHAKNATLEEYLKATALETLCGYLYLKDETARFLELLKAGIERAGIG